MLISSFDNRVGTIIGGWRGFWTPSRRMITCVAVDNPSEMCEGHWWILGAVGQTVWKWVLSWLIKLKGSGSKSVVEGVKNSPDSRRVVPYTISAVVNLRSSLSAFLIPSRMRGRVSIQASGLGWALRAALSCQWNLSTMPFVWGWYAVVLACLEPRRDMRLVQSWDSNCRPRSVMMVEGTPTREIHPLRKAWATALAVMAVRGMASGQRVKWSTQKVVRR